MTGTGFFVYIWRKVEELMTTVIKIFESLLPSLGTTLGIISYSIIATFVMGFLFSLVHFSRSKVVSKIYFGFVSVMRATPVLLLLMLVFYGFPLLFSFFGLNIENWPKNLFAVIAIALENSAYFSENLRSSYVSIPQSQYDACAALQLNRIQALRRIIGPQVFFAALPNIGNTLITVVKNSAYVYVIGITDLCQQAQITAQASFGKNQLTVFIVLSLFYWIACVLIQELIEWFGSKKRWGGIR